MDARLRTYVLVALAAAGTAALVVGLVAFTRTSPRAAAETSTTTPGRAPALVLDLGLRTDPEAVALRRANRLYSAGRRRAAGRIFARYKSVDAQVGAAVSAWPDGTLARLDELATRHPSSGVVLLHLGLAQVASRKASAAEAAWRKVLERDPDSEAAVQAESLLHPRFAPGRPPFVPSSGLPAEVVGLSPARQLAALERAARGKDAKAKLLYGSVDPSPRNGSSRLPRGSLQAMPRRRPRPRSASSRRPSLSLPSRGSARSRRAFRAPRPSASTSASCFSGSASSTKRARNCGSRVARARPPRSAERPPSSSRSYRDSRKPKAAAALPARPLTRTVGNRSSCIRTNSP